MLAFDVHIKLFKHFDQYNICFNFNKWNAREGQTLFLATQQRQLDATFII